MYSELSVSKSLWKEHWHVFYVSKVLFDTETRYSHMKKLVYAVVISTCKLKPYFECHMIEVITSFALRSILYRPDLVGMVLWTSELKAYDVQYILRTAIKSLILAEFVAEFTVCGEEVEKETKTLRSKWSLYVDVYSNAKGAELECCR